VNRLLLALCLLPALAFAQAPVIQISGANFRPMPIANPAPRATNDAARAAVQEFDQAFGFDLAAAGIFQLLDRKGFTASANEGLAAASIDFSRWADVGAEALVKTQLEGSAGELTGELRVYNVATSTELLKTSETVKAGQTRLLAHKLADALYKQFTREPGPFSSHLVYVKKTAAGKDVYLADWDGQEAQAIATGGINLLPALLPGAGGAAFTSYKSGKPEIWTARPGQKAHALVSAGEMATGISFSPDGKRIAYALAEGESAQIYVANADGSEPAKLTNTPFFINTSPSWSPDGKQLAFVSNRGGSPQIYVMGVDGSGVRRLTFQGNYNQTPSWSPRGDLIAFTARDERNAFDLFTVNVESGKITRLTQDTGNNEEPTFAPNGRLIVFSSTRTGSPRLFVMTADGNDQQPLPMDKGEFTTPDWGR
jgi:TolB protein